MDFSEFLVWLHASAFSSAVRENGLLFPSIESVHVLAVTLVVGSISIVDLRLLGLASANRSVASVAADILPFTWGAFLVAVLTGSALFASHAVGYAHNFQFRMKLLLLLLAGLNMAAFHVVMRRTSERWSEAQATPRVGRMAGSISLLLWIGIVTFGRWIGFEAVR